MEPGQYEQFAFRECGLNLAIFNPDELHHCNGSYTASATVVELYAVLSEYFNQIDLCAPVTHTTDEQPIEVDTDRLTVRELPTWDSGWKLRTTQLPSVFFGVWEVFRRHSERWDAVMISSPDIFGQVCYLLAKLHGIPTLLYLRGDARYELVARHEGIGWTVARLWSNVLDTVIRRMVSHSAVITAGSQLAKEYESSNGNIQPIVASVISRNELLDDLSKIQLPDSSSVNLLYVGRLVDYKGVEYLVDAMKLLDNRNTHRYHLDIVGSGRDRHRLERRIDELGITDSTAFHGFIRRKYLGRLYEKSDIFVLPSLSEGSPKTIPEALSHGVPVVATRVGGIPYLIKDGIDGLLIEPRNETAIADAVERIAEDEQLFRSLVENGLSKAETMTMETQAERIKDTLRATYPSLRIYE